MPDPIKSTTLAREQARAEFFSPTVECIGFAAFAGVFLFLAVANQGVDNQKAVGLACFGLASVFMTGFLGLAIDRSMRTLLFVFFLTLATFVYAEDFGILGRKNEVLDVLTHSGFMILSLSVFHGIHALIINMKIPLVKIL